MKDEINRVKLQVNRQNNLSVACDLRISVIPQIRDENLHQICDSICKAINISMPPYKSIYRTRNKNRIDRDGTIIIKFFTPCFKNNILKMF